MVLRLVRAGLLLLGGVVAFMILSVGSAQAGNVFENPVSGGGDPGSGGSGWSSGGSGSGGAGTANYAIRSAWAKRFPYSWRKNNKVPAPMGLYDNGYTRVGPRGSANASNPLMSQEMKRQYRGKNYKCWNSTSTSVARIDNGNSEQSFALGINWTQRIVWKSLRGGGLYAAKAKMRNVSCKHGTKMGVKWRWCPIEATNAYMKGPWGREIPVPGTNGTQWHTVSKANAPRKSIPQSDIQVKRNENPTRFGRIYKAGFPGKNQSQKIQATKDCGGIEARVKGERNSFTVDSMGNYEDGVSASVAFCSWTKYNRYVLGYTKSGATSATKGSQTKVYDNDRNNKGQHRNKQWIGCVDKTSSYATKRRAARAFGYNMTQMNAYLTDRTGTPGRFLLYWACEREADQGSGAFLEVPTGLKRLEYNTNDSFRDFLDPNCRDAWNQPLAGECSVDDPTPTIKVLEKRADGTEYWTTNRGDATLFANGKTTKISFNQPTFTKKPGVPERYWNTIKGSMVNKKVKYHASKFTGRFKNKTGRLASDPFYSNVNLKTGGTLNGWGAPLKLRVYDTPGTGAGVKNNQKITVTHSFQADDYILVTRHIWNDTLGRYVESTSLEKGARKTLSCTPMTASFSVLDTRGGN